MLVTLTPLFLSSDVVDLVTVPVPVAATAGIWLILGHLFLLMTP